MIYNDGEFVHGSQRKIKDASNEQFYTRDGKALTAFNQD